jgi:hypothetical protein
MLLSASTLMAGSLALMPYAANVPAEVACHRDFGPSRFLSTYSAMGLRQTLPVQTKSRR